MKPVTKKKKAFTLTELLVVVVVIGVLSAVVLPKFNKVMETRKTTEAEEMMAAVRTEQEKRCALDKNYLQDLSKMSDIIPNTDTKNFTYVATATGIKAHSKGKYGYTLQMPSYQDGRLCCDDADCAKLNKDYPSCSSLRSRADYLSGAECQGEDTDEDTDVKDCTGPRPSNTQSCSNGCGTQTRTVTCNTSTGVWETGAWSGDCSCECTGTKPTETQSCNSCGTQTRSVNCDTSTGEWVPGAWSQCSKTQQECDEENKEEEEDCCAEGVTDFAACILEKYGDNSTEYICASGKNIGYFPGVGSLSRASACAYKLMGFGSILRAANNTCEAGDERCNQLRQNNINWISGGFKRYACTGERPTTSTSSTDEDKDWVWETADWSNALIRNGGCETMDPAAIVAEHCQQSRAASNMSTSCSGTPKEGAICQLACYVGGKVYPQGTSPSKPDPNTVVGPFTDYDCTCLGEMVGSGPNAYCKGDQGCYKICVIPYTHKVKYAVQR